MMKKILIGILALGTFSTFAHSKEIHSCSAICVDKINYFPAGWQTLPVKGSIKSIIVSSLGKTRNEAVDKLTSKCRRQFEQSATITGGINYTASIVAIGNDLNESYYSAPFSGDSAPWGETFNLNCDSLKL